MNDSGVRELTPRELRKALEARDAAIKKARRKKRVVQSIVGAALTAIGGGGGAALLPHGPKAAITEAVSEALAPVVVRVDHLEARAAEDRAAEARTAEHSIRTETIVEMLAKERHLRLPPRHHDVDGGEP